MIKKAIKLLSLVLLVSVAVMPEAKAVNVSFNFGHHHRPRYCRPCRPSVADVLVDIFAPRRIVPVPVIVERPCVVYNCHDSYHRRCYAHGYRYCDFCY